jgi:hypothetical protein
MLTQVQYEQSYSQCRLCAETTKHEEIRLLWLSIEDASQAPVFEK